MSIESASYLLLLLFQDNQWQIQQVFLFQNNESFSSVDWYFDWLFDFLRKLYRWKTWSWVETKRAMHYSTS